MPASAPGFGDDAGLARLAAAGSRAAFGTLVRRHSDIVRAQLRRMGAAPDVADDVAQEAWLVAFQRVGTFRGDGGFGAWMKQIAARLYIRRWRRELKTDLLVETDDEEADTIVETGDRMDLDRALRSLSPAERLCVSLCLGAGFSHPEAADLLQIPVGTVKSHVKRGLDRLRKRMAAEPAERTRGGRDG